jgi:BirA family transcriptional regulator, biotin operon repressor / biotin---[acetyl-CoA-carboxylase] ligase
MQQSELFSILDSVESTNNYAMAQVHAGLATHGQAWFAKEQWAGKGQRGKEWTSAVGKNIILSVAIKPSKVFASKPFIFSMLIANACRYFFAEIAKETIKIKWPNDIYFNDRKAGGILIENIFKGKEWQWAVVGIGINVNQIEFPPALTNATSLKIITQKENDTIILAKKLHAIILQEIAKGGIINLKNVLETYNINLYKKEEEVALKKDNAVFNTIIKSVNEYGYLETEDVIERQFVVGEVEWVR